MFNLLFGSLLNLTEGGLKLINIIMAAVKFDDETDPKTAIMSLARNVIEATKADTSVHKVVTALGTAYLGMALFADQDVPYSEAMDSAKFMVTVALVSEDTLPELEALLDAKIGAVATWMESFELISDPQAQIAAALELVPILRN